MASAETYDLAQRLIAFEAAHHDASDVNGGITCDSAVQVVEILRMRLVKLVGVEGFRVLLARALTLAKAENPALQEVKVGANGSLEGFDSWERSTDTAGETAGQSGMILVAHLLALLETFIGESLTLRLVRNAWPDACVLDASQHKANLNTEEKA